VEDEIGNPADALTGAADSSDALTDTSAPALRRDGLATRIAPFAALAILAEASLALPPVRSPSRRRSPAS